MVFAANAGAAAVKVYLDRQYYKQFRTVERDFRSFSQRINSIGQSVRIPAMMAGGGMAASINSFADVQSQLAHVSTMLERPSQYMEEYQKSLERTRLIYGDVSASVAKGLYDILSASVGANKALSVLQAGTRSAKAGFTETATSVDLLTTMLNAYRLSADKAVDVTDWAFAVVRRGKIEYPELAQNIGLVASTARMAGLSIEELGALIALLTRKGIKAENAITSINAILNTFISPAEQSRKEAAKFGLELSTATIKAEGFLGVLKKLSGISTDSLGKIFPNIRAIRGVIPALQDTSGYEKDLRAVSDRAGETERAFAKVSGTARMAIDQLKEAGKILMEAFGESFADVAMQEIHNLKQTLVDLAKYLRENKAFVSNMASGLITVAKYAAVIWGLGKAFGMLSVVVGKTGSALKVLAGIKNFSSLFGRRLVANSMNGSGRGLADTFKQVSRHSSVSLRNSRALTASLKTAGFAAGALAAAWGGYELGKSWKEMVQGPMPEALSMGRQALNQAEKQRNATEEIIERVQRLNALKNRSRKEDQQMLQLLQKIPGVYSEVKGSLKDLITDQKELNRVLGNLQVRAVDRQMKTLQLEFELARSNVDRLLEYREKLTQGRNFSVVDMFGGDKDKINEVNRQIDEARKNYNDLHQKMQALSTRREAAKRGEKVELDDKAKKDFQQKLLRQELAARQELGRLQQEFDEKSLDDTTRKFRLIQKETDELVRQYELLKRIERQKSKPDRLTLDMYDEKIASVKKTGSDRSSKVLADYEAARKAQLEKQAREKRDRQQQARDQREALRYEKEQDFNRYTSGEKSLQRQRQQRSEDWGLEDAFRKGNEEGVSALKQLLDSYRMQADQVEEQYRKAYGDVWADNEKTPDEQQRLSDILSASSRIGQRIFDLEGKLHDAANKGEKLKQQPNEVRGAFGAATAYLGIGLNAAQDEIAANTRTLTKTNNRIERNTRSSGGGIKME